jgi:hydrogenase expression/formation protein HypE
LPKVDRGRLHTLADSTVLSGITGDIAFTTDSFVVSPIFFPGGDIGSLSVHGTCNDLACSGARPLFLSLGLILEEGFPMDELELVLGAIGKASDHSSVEVVTGDTKVVPKGSCDKIFINTSGIGKVECRHPLSGERIIDGDIVLVSGPVGNHGMAVMLSRAEFSFDFDVKSDSASVWPIVEKLLELGPDLKFLRDPTRGGLAATLNEIAALSDKGMLVDESLLPVDPAVVNAADILGIDPLQAANEGKIVAIISSDRGGDALRLLEDCPLARGAVIVGKICSDHPKRVVVRTRIGGSRIMAEPSGELLPRIC